MIPNDYQFVPDIERITEQLTTLYKDLAIGINGDIFIWEPSVYGGSVSGTTTYDHRSGWAWRRGLMVDLWMDVQWTGSTGSGDLTIALPYKVINSDNQPFVGVIENRSGLNLDVGYTYLTWRASPNTFESTIRESGDNVSSQPLSLTNSGRLIGHICYIGQEYE
jgi:hypothetical protein